MADRCLLLCKDKNFKANHNDIMSVLVWERDVCYSAKIRILKQITTCKSVSVSHKMMFVTLQR